MKKHIPNIITLCNQMCGILAAIFAYELDFSLALLFVVGGALFDFCDGATARLLRVQSPMGKELDSLADMITFGLVPGIVAFRILDPLAAVCLFIPYVGFLLTLFSALRLAKFNIDTRQTSSFRGLATPANALLWLGIANMPLLTESPTISLYTFYAIIALVVICSLLMVSEIPMFSLKFHNFKWKENWVRYIFLALSLVLLITFRQSGLVYVILLYILMSIALRRYC